uniref:Family with sequence similarity 185 member A n=1 Tax=Gorilla gorilla gorilla TaxID=9595 RepID=A0A2I2YNJ7_GORGO
MLAPCSGWELGCFRLCFRQVRLWAGAGRWACWACQARPYSSGGGERWPGSETEVPPPGPARRTLKEWTLQGQKLHVQTKGGKVICLGTVYGNIDIHASDKSNITLQSKMGNITVDSSSGCLKASTNQGAIHVYVSQLGKVELKSHKGSIIVKVPSSLQAHLQLSGKEVDVNSEVHVQEMAEACKDDVVTVTGLMNQASKREKWIKADAPKGTVSFRRQSWFQSLKLQD